MLLGHFTKLQKYNVPISTVQLAKRQVKQNNFWLLVIRRNVSKESEFRISGGRLFQARTAATENARSPSVVRRVDGSCSVRLSAILSKSGSGGNRNYVRWRPQSNG